jgi:tRNA nucleotidyltransferase (CCA-adding enzyme)
VIRQVGATTTILSELLRERNIEISPAEATILMLGIYEDTGSLTFTSTTPEDYSMAAYLLERGANLNVVSDMITKDLTAEQVSLLNELIQNATVHIINGVEVVIAKVSRSNYVGDFSLLVHKLKDIENINLLFALADMEDRIYLVARSRTKEVNVGEVAAEFGGGGHQTAASANIKGLTLIQAENKLKELLKKYIKPINIAKDVMSSPAKSIDASDSLKMAGELMTRYNINALPVLETGRLVGIITRQIIEKASFHGLKDVPVKEYMISEFATVKPQTSWVDVQRLIVENNQRFLPVIEGGKLTGVITRTDLLRVLHTDSDEEPRYLYTSHDDTLHKDKGRAISKLMDELLPKQVIGVLKIAGKIAEELKMNSYAVGGFVRDLLLHNANFDIDLVVEGDGIKFARKFASHYGGTVTYHKKFGTAVINLPGKIKVDVASARLEYYERPAALPQVEMSSIKLDLYRRDFTINTLAVKLNPRSFGEMIDFFGAKKDIKDKTIRVLHNLSFVEDPTRVLRALRFEQRFGFQLSKLTANLIQNAVKMNFFDNLSGRRLSNELILVLQEENVPPLIKRMDDFDLLKLIHPKLVFTEHMKELLERIHNVLSWFKLLFLDKQYDQWIVYFAGIMDGLKKEEIKTVAEKLSLNREEALKIYTVKEKMPGILFNLSSPAIKNSTAYHLLTSLPIEAQLYLMAKTTSEHVRKAVSHYFTHSTQVKVELSGDDLISLGLTPGKIFKKIFHEVLNAKLDGVLKNREDELRFIKEHFPQSKIH